jgi:hypothetical protein
MTRPLSPRRTLAALLPADTVFAARSPLDTIRLAGGAAWNSDTITGNLFGLLNGVATLRHASCVTPLACDLLRHGGLHVEEAMQVYETASHFAAMLRQEVASGRRVLCFYPIDAGQVPQSALMVPDRLYAQMNDKARLPDLVAARYLPGRRLDTAAGFARRPPETPCFLKVTGARVTGAGTANRYVEDPRGLAPALAELQGLMGDTPLLAEEAVSVTGSWCVSFFVSDCDVITLGAAEQTFASPGRQNGSRVVGTAAVAPDFATIVRAAGRRAAARGFRGVAAFDIGRRPDGRPVVFDPNFRINASTQQVLLHDSIVARSGRTVTLSFAALSDAPLERLDAALRRFIDARDFVPFRLVDGRLLPSLPKTTHIAGVICADSIGQAAALRDDLAAALEAGDG